MKCGAFGHMNIDKRYFLDFNEIMTNGSNWKEIIIDKHAGVLCMERHMTLTPHWQAGIVTSSSQRCVRFVHCQMFLRGEDLFSGRDGDEIQHLEHGRFCRREADGNGGFRS